MKQAVCSLRHLSQLPLLGERGPRLESNSQNFCPKTATVLYHVPLPQVISIWPGALSELLLEEKLLPQGEAG